MPGFEERLKGHTEQAESIVLRYLPDTEGPAATLTSAMNYAVKGGGKRLRPILMESAARLVRGDGKAVPESVIGPFMAAIEYMHSASLIHDDLPCMDSDTLRRGKPSTWYKYGEDMGVLAGDALMIYTFETALRSSAEPQIRARALSILAAKSGVYGMTGGQSADVELTGKTPGEKELVFIYELKTACLIEASLMIGGVLAGAGEDRVLKLCEAGRYIGLSFQIADDILDVTGSEEELGKPIGSDEEQGKYTWVSLYGLDKAGDDVRKYSLEAIRLIEEIGDYPFLTDLILYLAGRRK